MSISILGRHHFAGIYFPPPQGHSLSEQGSPDRHQERRRQNAEEWPEIHHPLPFAYEGRRLFPQADHPRRNGRSDTNSFIHLLTTRHSVIQSDDELALACRVHCPVDLETY